MRKIQKLWHVMLWIFSGILMTLVVIYAFFRVGYEYTYYRDYKSVKNIKTRYIYPWEKDRFETDLPVEFVSEMHNARVVQKLHITAENRKSYTIFRFADDHIQLMRSPVKKFMNIRWITAYYNITDKSAKEKLLKLLDARREPEE